MIKKRLQDIVRILLHQDGELTIQALAEKLQVSYKTISNDLKVIAEWLQDNDLELEKKPGVGVRVFGTDEAKLRISHLPEIAHSNHLDFSPQARVTYLGIKLLMDESGRIYQLADELFVSRATIHKDLIALTDLYANYKLKLSRNSNSGISVSGSEKNIRRCLIDLMKDDSGYTIFYRIVQNPHYICTGSFPFAAIDMTDDEIAAFLTVLLGTKNNYMETVMFESLVQICLYVLVSFLRIRANRSIQLSPEFIAELTQQPYYESVRNICSALEEHHGLAYSETEMRYLQVFFLSLKNTDEVSSQDLSDARQLANAMIAEWERVLPYPFSEEQELYRFLFQHFCSAVTRYKHGIPSENSLIEDIKLKHPHTFDIVKQSKFLIEDKYACQLDQEEIGLLTLHLAVALDKMKEPLQTLVVCHEGIGVTNLLVQKIQTQLSNLIQVKRVATSFQIVAEDLEDVDLVLTTMKLPLQTMVPLLEVEPLLSKQDLIWLRKSVLPYYEAKNDHMQKRGGK